MQGTGKGIVVVTKWDAFRAVGTATCSQLVHHSKTDPESVATAMLKMQKEWMLRLSGRVGLCLFACC